RGGGLDARRAAHGLRRLVTGGGHAEAEQENRGGNPNHPRRISEQDGRRRRSPQRQSFWRWIEPSPVWTRSGGPPAPSLPRTVEVLIEPATVTGKSSVMWPSPV